MSGQVCSIDSCDRDVVARGWCGRHWQRWRRTGDPEGSKPRGPRADSWRHGSRRGYDLGCRCFDCRVANNRYQEAWRNGRPARTPAAEILPHIEQLLASGWTRTGICEDADVSANTVWYLTSGRVKSVNRRTAAALLSVEPLRGRLWLDAGPLIKAVMARRVPLTELLPDLADRRAFYRARADRCISDGVADRLAVRALGLTLEELYGPAWDEEAVPA